MTFTYDNTDLSTDLAKIRSAIGDVVEHPDYSLTDEEINARLTEYPDRHVAAVACQEDRISRALLHPSSSVHGIQRNAIVDALERHLKTLKKRAGKGKLHSYFGGISKARKSTLESDTDFTRPSFEVGRDDFAGTPRGASTYSEDDDDV